MEKLIHPDLHLVVPVNRPKGTTGSKPPITDDFVDLWRQAYLENPLITEQEWYERLDIENKQGIISAAEAESITRKVQFKPFESQNKVILIWLPERMHITAANKLLKILEEPPAGTYFFLVSQHPHQLLPTIRSRCMTVQVPAPSAREIAAEKTAPFIRLLDLCLKSNAIEVYGWADNMAANGREAQKSFIISSVQTLREFYMVRLGVPQLAHLCADDMKTATALTPRLPLPFFEAASKRLEACTEQLERNVNARVLFCSLAFDFFLTLQK